jgi:hypothetical protein
MSNKFVILKYYAVNAAWSVHVNRVSSANTSKNIKYKVFRDSVVLHTLEHSITDQIKRVVSQLQPASHSCCLLARSGLRVDNSRHIFAE